MTTSKEVTGVGVHVDDGGNVDELELVGGSDVVADVVDGGGADVELGGGFEEVGVDCGVELVD